MHILITDTDPESGVTWTLSKLDEPYRVGGYGKQSVLCSHTVSDGRDYAGVTSREAAVILKKSASGVRLYDIFRSF